MQTTHDQIIEKIKSLLNTGFTFKQDWSENTGKHSYTVDKIFVYANRVYINGVEADMELAEIEAVYKTVKDMYAEETDKNTKTRENAKLQAAKDYMDNVTTPTPSKKDSTISSILVDGFDAPILAPANGKIIALSDDGYVTSNYAVIDGATQKNYNANYVIEVTYS